MRAWISLNRSNRSVYLPGASSSRCLIIRNTFTPTAVLLALTKARPNVCPLRRVFSMSVMISRAL